MKKGVVIPLFPGGLVKRDPKEYLSNSRPKSPGYLSDDIQSRCLGMSITPIGSLHDEDEEDGRYLIGPVRGAVGRALDSIGDRLDLVAVGMAALWIGIIVGYSWRMF